MNSFWLRWSIEQGARKDKTKYKRLYFTTFGVVTRGRGVLDGLADVVVEVFEVEVLREPSISLVPDAEEASVVEEALSAVLVELSVEVSNTGELLSGATRALDSSVITSEFRSVAVLLESPTREL